MKRLMMTMTAAAMVATAVNAENSMVADVEIGIDDPTDKGRILVNASFTPVESADYDKLVFTCTLRQVLEIPAPDGGTIEKIYEPVKFKYTRANETMVKDLRKHIHFPVPVGLEELRDKYGRLTFKFDKPVTVSHVHIDAYADGEIVWQIDRDVAPGPREERSNMINMMR